MRVLVCGGRDYDDDEQVCETLRLLNGTYEFENRIEVIMSGLAKGADSLAERWAKENHILFEGYQADWDKYGKAAGSIRNKYMIDKGKPDLVVAFPGGKGTQDMIRQAEEAGIKIVRI